MAVSNDQLKSELILEELKRRQMTKEVVDVEEGRVKVVIFVCGLNRYAFYGTDIREILPASEISWVPSLPDYIPGLINVRGDIESVIDLHYFLGEEKVESGKLQIAMAVRGEFHSGIMIDSIVDVLDIALSNIQPPLATLSGAVRDLVTGEIEYGGETISLLDVGKLEALITV
ncbi:MAG: chemotaxis protein CheW [Desulfuromonadaceae bacterium]|nr:chemotaxis protein CheW [Desulfuromonadaceae bacterium]MDD2854614.1 chemotaxis protein CheW [Desulfuromonadaceae bacterium]